MVTNNKGGKSPAKGFWFGKKWVLPVAFHEILGIASWIGKREQIGLVPFYLFHTCWV